MRTSILLPALASLTLLLSLGGCSVNPVTGESQFSLISASQEVAIGAKQYQPSQQSQGGRYIVDPDLTPYVNRVGQKLARVSDRAKLPYEFVVLNNGVPNAWALPGGKIAINRGLLIQLNDEAQLAAVLGHEITHAAARHGASQMTKGMLLGAGVQVVGIATQNSGYGQLATTGASLGAGAWQARYGRGQELEADNYGMDYMVRAGYDPLAAVELQQTFVRLSQQAASANGKQGNNWLEGLFSSHPPSQQRVDANRIKARQYPGGARNKTAFDRAMANLRRDQPAYQAYEKGMKALSEKNYSLALSQANSALNQQSGDPLFWELKGVALAQNKKTGEAITAFTKGIQSYPEYFSSYLRRGLLYQQQGNNTKAEKDLSTSQQYLRTQTASYHLGEIALAQGKKQKAIGYFQSVAQSGGKLGTAAQKKLTILLPPPEKKAEKQSSGNSFSQYY